MEIVAAVCERMEDMDCMRVRMACRGWREMMDEGEWWWRHVASRNLYGEETSQGTWLETFAERNLIHNPSGEDGLSGWKVSTREFAIMRNKQIRPSYRWRTETVPTILGPTSAFATANCQCCKSQTVNLFARGFNLDYLDSRQPPIRVSDCLSTRWDANSLYSLTCMLLDQNFRVIAQFSSGNVVCPSASGPEKPSPFKKIEYVFENYGKGVRYILFEHAGSEDMSVWRGNGGHFGAYMTKASVRILVREGALSC